MEPSKRVAVIMAGGVGERFWPLSTPQRPKQLLKLTDPNRTMLQEAVERIAPAVDETFVATSPDLSKPIREAQYVSAENVFAEPARRNTLGALCWTTAQLLTSHARDTLVAILTADHLIVEEPTFRADVAKALDLAEQSGGLVTIGIRPTRPETGYGYIEIDGNGSPDVSVHRCLRFREKPNQETAEQFVASGSFFWNSGMFFWRLDAFLRELDRLHPSAAQAVETMATALRDGDQAGAVEAFANVPNESVDYALMERAENVFVVPATFGWDDVGAWDALARSFPTDVAGNVIHGRVIAEESSSSVIYNDDPDTVVGVVGIEDLVVVVTEGRVLVCPKSHAQRVKLLANQLNPK